MSYDAEATRRRVLSISVDHDTADADAQAFSAEATVNAFDAIQVLHRQWLVDSTEHVEAWTERARRRFGRDTEVLVFEVGREFWGYGDQFNWLWIRSHLRGDSAEHLPS